MTQDLRKIFPSCPGCLVESLPDGKPVPALIALAVWEEKNYDAIGRILSAYIRPALTPHRLSPVLAAIPVYPGPYAREILEALAFKFAQVERVARIVRMIHIDRLIVFVQEFPGILRACASEEFDP